MTFCGVFRAYLAAEKECGFFAGVLYLWSSYVLLFSLEKQDQNARAGNPVFLVDKSVIFIIYAKSSSA